VVKEVSEQIGGGASLVGLRRGGEKKRREVGNNSFLVTVGNRWVGVFFLEKRTVCPGGGGGWGGGERGGGGALTPSLSAVPLIQKCSLGRKGGKELKWEGLLEVRESFIEESCQTCVEPEISARERPLRNSPGGEEGIAGEKKRRALLGGENRERSLVKEQIQF